MISRRATKILSELINEIYKGTYKRKVNNGITYSYEYEYEFKTNDFYDFLYERDYPEWFLLLTKTLRSHDERSILEYIMGLNIGDFGWRFNQSINIETKKKLMESAKIILYNLVIDTLNNTNNRERAPKIHNLHQKLIYQLELDGYIYQNNQLYKSENNIVNTEEESGIIHKLVTEMQLSNQNVIFHHLKLIETDYLDQKWDDSISNSRKFLESVLQEIAKRYSQVFKGEMLSDEYVKKAINIRKYLEDEQVFSEEEITIYRTSYGLLSATGNHPYIAEKDQAALMQNMVMTLAHFALLRYQGLSHKAPQDSTF